jgi:hypothetical protein
MVGVALLVDGASLADEVLWAAADLRADAQLGDFTVAQFAVAERFALAERFAVVEPFVVAEAVSTAVVVDTVVVADMAVDTGKFVRGLI